MRDSALVGPWVRRFLLEHLVIERNLAQNTQRSYRDTLGLLLPFASTRRKKPVDQLTVDDLSSSVLKEFLERLETERGCAVRTRNQRLAAMHALARFISERSPEHIEWCGKIRAATALASARPLDAPVFEITAVESTIKFDVKASVAIVGKFEKWNATLTFTSPELSTGVLDIKIQTARANTGSGMKDGKLKSKDFFNVDQDPYITFHSTKFEQTGPNTVAIDGDFTIRGVTKQERLIFTILDPKARAAGMGIVTETMAFDRKQYGMNSGIPFIKIADRVEVDLSLKVHRLSGPPVNLK